MIDTETDMEKARGLARQQLRRSIAGADRLISATVAVLVVSIVWLGWQTLSAVKLQQHGVHALARIDGVSDGRHPSIWISYPASSVYVSIPLWFETGNYRTGGHVEISYDRRDPSHAVVAHGIPTPGGWEGLPFFLLIGAVALTGIGIYARSRTMRSGATIEQQPRSMTVMSTAVATTDNVELTLHDGGTAIASLGRQGRKGVYASTTPTPVLVFGEPTPKGLVYVVDVEHGTALLRALRPPPRNVRDDE